MNRKPSTQASWKLPVRALLIIAAIVVIGTGVWLIGRHPTVIPSNLADPIRWPTWFIGGLVAAVFLLILLHAIHEERVTRRTVADALRGRDPLTDDEFGSRFYESGIAPVAVRLRRLLAENLECDLSGLIPSDDFARWLELFPGIDSSADCFFEEMAIEFQLSRDAPWPNRFESFDELVKFVKQHSPHKKNARSVVVGEQDCMTFPIFKRDEHGIPHIEAADEAALFFGQGMAHATDRAMQMVLMRIVGQGRVSEILDSSEESLRVDRFFRRANWYAHTQPPLEQLSLIERSLLQAYCDGVNHALARRVPWEFKLCRHRPEPWKPEDTVLLLRMIGYLTLAASQSEMERLFVEMVQAGVAEEKLHELFPGILGGLDVELIKQVKLGERLVPRDLWGVPMPRLMASNNWVISGKKSASGKPILSNDPHLEGNRLPAVWCEISLRCGERYLLGGSIPGIPGVLSGRNNDLAWGCTYAFADAQDSWIEQCRGGKCYREDGDRWIEFRRRREVIKRRKKPAAEMLFFENEHGVLDGDPQVEGYYLATRWAPADSGAGALKASFGLFHATSVDRGMELLGAVETAWNFVLADRQGNIGYQMSGQSPRRRAGVSGFVPLPGWKRENDWRGFVALEDLPRLVNPLEGFFATANEDLNRFGKTYPINMPMGPYRGDRARQLLATRNNFTVADMCAMHFDVYSRQAELFIDVLRPLLPCTPEADRLRNWDLKYTADSEGAYLFERFYEQLYHEVFGKGGLGERVVDALREQTGAFTDFYHNFDRVLLAEKSAWFGGRSRDEIFREAVSVALRTPPQKWGQVHRFDMTNIFFNGRIPRFLGFDRGPFSAIGNRATIHQAQLYTSGGRRTSFLPALRIVTDLATDEIQTTLAGGPSDRRFSRWYASDVANWLNGRYKTLTAL